MAVTKEQVTELYVATFNRAPDADGLNYWVNSNLTIVQIAEAFFLEPETQGKYPEGTTDEAFVTAIYQNVFNRDPDADGLAFWVGDGGLGGGVPRSEMILTVIGGAQNDDAVILANKTEVGLYYADELGLGGIGPFPLTDVTEDPATVAAAIEAANALVPDFVLTQMADNLEGTLLDDVFLAPVTQNQTGSGQLANTLETGDVLDGGDGTDVLRADLIETGSISDSILSPAISATTNSIEQVYLRQQSPQLDVPVNGSTIDAEKMAGVEQWWSDNSRSGIQIEDIRTPTEETFFGMRLTDPNVNYTAYFNALFLDTLDSGSSAFSFVIAETGDAAAEIANINVIAIRFEYEGVNYSLDSADVAEADTWAELTAALQADIDAEPALAGLTVTHVGGGLFNVVDDTAGVFDIDPAGTVVTASTVNETKDAALGIIAPEESPNVTNVVLDGAGNGSIGGNLTIGAMSGLRGVEVFDVLVDRDSHLTQMRSSNLNAAVVPNQFLEVVNLNSIGAEGDLQVGARTVTLDDRANVAGLVDVREVNGGDFLGDLNLGISLTNFIVTRYLDDADDVVEFIYSAGVGDDLFNIIDLSGGVVSGDEDFSMTVDMAAGDDILVINVPTVTAVSVDGGTGENVIKVSQSHGVNAGNTFAEFANFQTYEVEGNVALTQHDFANMPGVDEVVIATVGNVSTQLVNLEVDQNVTISGKNQTFGAGNSSNDQFFNVITLTNDAGVERTVTLENTARLADTAGGVRQNGVLTVGQLVVNENVLPLFPGTSATTDFTVDSAGERNVANAVVAFNGRDVETLNLIGTQDLTFNVAEISNQAAAAGVSASTALDIDASELEGDLNLAVTGAMIGNWGTATGLTDRIVGTDGDNDTLMLWGAQGNIDVNVTEFETIQFGTARFTMFGDVNFGGAPIDATGIYDAQSTDASHFVIVDDFPGNTPLTLNNLGTGVTVDMGDANPNAAGAVVNNQIFNDVITLNSGAGAVTPAAELTVNYLSNIVNGSVHNLFVGTFVPGPSNDTNGYQTVNIDVAHAGNLTNAALGTSTGVDGRLMNLFLTEDARVLNLSGGADNSGFTDFLVFNAQLPNALTTVDISDYEGNVTITMQQGNFIPLFAPTQTDVRFIMSEDSANITLSNMDNSLAIGTGVQHNSVFEFTGANSTTNVSTWTINNIVGSGVLSQGAGATIDNFTRFDLTDLGITEFNQLNISAVDAFGALLPAGTLSIRSEAQDDASILTGVNQNTWEIQVTDLVGVLAVPEITADNFIFA